MVSQFAFLSHNKLDSYPALKELNIYLYAVPILSYSCPSRMENPGKPFHSRGEHWRRSCALLIPLEQIHVFLWSVLIPLRPDTFSLGVQHKPAHCIRNPQPWHLLLITQGLHSQMKRHKQNHLLCDAPHWPGYLERWIFQATHLPQQS